MAALSAQQHYGTAITACVCVLSTPLFDPDLHGGNGITGVVAAGGGIGAMGNCYGSSCDPDDEQLWSDDGEGGGLVATRAYALLVSNGADYDADEEEEEGGNELEVAARALQRHEVERSCRMGMSVGALEEMWMEKIDIELEKIGKRRRRRKRLVHGWLCVCFCEAVQISHCCPLYSLNHSFFMFDFEFVVIARYRFETVLRIVFCVYNNN